MMHASTHVATSMKGAASQADTGVISAAGAIELCGRQLRSLQFTFPLRLVAPNPHPSAPEHRSVYMLGHGGGLVSGDRVSLRISLSDHSSLALLTQGSTKVFKARSADTTAPSKRAARQHITSHVSTDSLLCVLPGPTTPYADSLYEQSHVVYLQSPQSSLVYLDWFTAGRMSRGEVWDFEVYDTSVKVFVAGSEVIRDHWLLEDEPELDTDSQALANGAKEKKTRTRTRTYANRMHPYLCYATLIIMGSRVKNLIDCAEASFGTVKVSATAKTPVVWSLSRLPDYGGEGIIIRAASMTTAAMRAFINGRLSGLEDEIGENLFAKEI